MSLNLIDYAFFNDFSLVNYDVNDDGKLFEYDAAAIAGAVAEPLLEHG